MECPTNCLYETDYSVYTTRQASRRSWRIGQTQPVQVVFMVGEPGAPKRRDRNETPTLSLFEWALDREREGELVGAVLAE